MRAREVMKDGSLPTEYEVNYKYVNKEEGEERDASMLAQTSGTTVACTWGSFSSSVK